VATLYFIRHGQAGSLDDYDRLSMLGEQQAQLLGEYLAARNEGFDELIAGDLRRQRETARLVAQGLRSVSGELAINTDARWNEFDMSRVYQDLLPALLADSPDFARDWAARIESLKQDPRTTRGAAGRCDRAVIEAWMENRYPGMTNESWSGFCERVCHAWDSLRGRDASSRVAVFTSATPIAVGVGRLLSLPQEKILRLMAVLYNSGITIVRLHREEPLLVTFNSTPHLADPAVVTFR
jgi:broad specificity phosphatase PhoE